MRLNSRSQIQKWLFVWKCLRIRSWRRKETEKWFFTQKIIIKFALRTASIFCQRPFSISIKEITTFRGTHQMKTCQVARWNDRNTSNVDLQTVISPMKIWWRTWRKMTRDFVIATFLSWLKFRTLGVGSPNRAKRTFLLTSTISRSTRRRISRAGVSA